MEIVTVKPTTTSKKMMLILSALLTKLINRTRMRSRADARPRQVNTWTLRNQAKKNEGSVIAVDQIEIEMRKSYVV